MKRKNPIREVHTARGVLSGKGPWTSWNAIYRGVRPEDLPWNAGGPDAELVRLVESGEIAPSRALDLGAGPGHDAIYLAKRGFRVLALDISPAALKLARANARKAGAAERIRFQVKDAAKLDVPPGSVAFANDRGCFHVLDASGRRAYLQGLARALAPEGILLLRVFSDKEPPGPGPRRFSKNELVGFFRSKFRVLKIKSGVFKGPRRPKAYVCLLRRLA